LRVCVCVCVYKEKYPWESSDRYKLLALRFSSLFVCFVSLIGWGLGLYTSVEDCHHLSLMKKLASAIFPALTYPMAVCLIMSFVIQIHTHTGRISQS
jgi:hypothetical protein